MGKAKGKKGEKSTPPVPGGCLYCNRTDDDELKYGKLIYHKEQNIRVHHYCLLFASGLCQAGEGNEGIEGFLIPDIMKEYARSSRLRCVYCKQTRATIGCTIKSCRHMYHYGCGVENKVLFLFYDNFISYCRAHRSHQEQPEVPSETATVTCAICLESVEAKVSEDTLRTPCCVNTWFHRTCVQRQALSAGYFFRCGICNNKEDFQREMKQFGIYIPEQDAAWELEENAYQELYQRHNQCDVQPCICPKGRKYHPSRGKWEVVLCDTCGSRGCHLTCGGLTNQWDDWVCDQCEEVVSKNDLNIILGRSANSTQLSPGSLALSRTPRNIRPPLRFDDHTTSNTSSPSTSTRNTPSSSASSMPSTSQGSSHRRAFSKRQATRPSNQPTVANVTQQLQDGQASLSEITQMLHTTLQPLQKPVSQLVSMVQGIQKAVGQIGQTTLRLQRDIAQLQADVTTIGARQVAIVDQQRRNRNLMKRIWDEMQDIDDAQMVDAKQSKKQV